MTQLIYSLEHLAHRKKENTPWLEHSSTVENRHTGTYKQETYTQNKIQLNWFTLELTLLE